MNPNVLVKNEEDEKWESQMKVSIIIICKKEVMADFISFPSLRK